MLTSPAGGRGARGASACACPGLAPVLLIRLSESIPLRIGATKPSQPIRARWWQPLWRAPVRTTGARWISSDSILA